MSSREIQINEGISYLGSFPDKAEWWFLMIEDARLYSREIRILKELTPLQAALTKPLKLRAHHFALTELLTSSPHSISLGVRSVWLCARDWLRAEQGSCRGKGGMGRRACSSCWWYRPPSIPGQAVAAESWALPRFLVRPTQTCGNHRKACMSMHVITIRMAVLHWQGWVG